MDPKMVKLALKMVGYGAEKIPDKIFDAIPGGYYKAKDPRKAAAAAAADRHRGHGRDRSRRRRAYSEPESDGDMSDYYYSDYDTRRNRRRRRHSNDVPSGRQSRREDMYGYPPEDAYGRPEARSNAAGPNDGYYGAQPSYGSQQYQQYQQYPPPPSQPPPQQQQQQGSYYNDTTAAVNGSQYPGANDPRGSAGFDQERGDRYQRYYDDNRYNSDESYSRSSNGRGRQSRRRRDSRSSSRSSSSRRSRSGIRGKLSGRLEPKSAIFFPGAVGAITGGLIGSEVGNGKLATVAGAVIGAAGLTAWGTHRNKKLNKELDKITDNRAARAKSVRAQSRPRERRDRDDGYDSF